MKKTPNAMFKICLCGLSLMVTGLGALPAYSKCEGGAIGQDYTGAKIGCECEDTGIRKVSLGTKTYVAWKSNDNKPKFPFGSSCWDSRNYGTPPMGYYSFSGMGTDITKPRDVWLAPGYEDPPYSDMTNVRTWRTSDGWAWVKCPSSATVSSDRETCNCKNGLKYSETNNTCVKTATRAMIESCAKNMDTSDLDTATFKEMLLSNKCQCASNEYISGNECKKCSAGQIPNSSKTGCVMKPAQTTTTTGGGAAAS